MGIEPDLYLDPYEYPFEAMEVGDHFCVPYGLGRAALISANAWTNRARVKHKFAWQGAGSMDELWRIA